MMTNFVLICAALIQTGTLAQPPAVPLSMTRLALDLSVDYEARTVGGTAILTVRNASHAPVLQVPMILNRLMTVSQVTDGSGRRLDFAQDVVTFTDDPSRQVNSVVITLPVALGPRDSVSVAVTYGGVLTGYTETGSLYIRDHVSRQFTIIREDAYAFPVVTTPSMRALLGAPRVPFAFSAKVTVPRGLTVAMGGSRGEARQSDSLVTWTYKSTAPVPFLNITIAPYRTLEARGFRLFYFPDDSSGAVSVRDAVTNALDRFARWYGPLGVTPDIALMEIPEGYGSQASLTAGIILTTDAFRDRAQLRQLYHELSHLWNVADLDVPSPRWNEGLATFLQWRMAAELDGWGDWNARAEATAQSLLRRCTGQSGCAGVPLAEYGRRGLTDYAYSVGFLMFHALHQTLGSTAFDNAYRAFFQQHKAAGATTPALARAFTATDSRAERILSEWLYSTRWHVRLSSGESMAGIVASYAR